MLHWLVRHQHYIMVSSSNMKPAADIPSLPFIYSKVQLAGEVMGAEAIATVLCQAGAELAAWW